VASLTVENYVKAIFQICASQSGRPAATGQVAAAMSVSPGTVTSMLKTLQESDLVTYTKYEGVQLTQAGKMLALRVLRRHRLIELFLSKTLEMTWDEVHAEAEHLEHAVSDLLVDRIDSWLGYPKFNPHGDPIPTSEGSLRKNNDARVLVDYPPGQSFRLARVLDQSPGFLRYLSTIGLTLGAEATLSEILPEAGIVTIEIAGKKMPLAFNMAQKLLVDEPTFVE